MENTVPPWTIYSLKQTAIPLVRCFLIAFFNQYKVSTAILLIMHPEF